MNPIRILHMLGSMNIGGSQTMVLSLYRAIDREKIQFDFILDHPDQRELASQFEELGARIYTMPTFKLYNIGEVRRAWNRFFTEHPEYKVLHSHVRSYASVYLPIAKKHGLTTIIHSHSTSNGSGFAALVKAVLQYPLRYQADYFFSCSEDAGQWLFGKKIASSDRHSVIKNPIDAAKFRYDPQARAQYRDAFSLKDKLVYINVSRLTPPKNHIFLLRVFQKLHSIQPNAVLLLVGDGELRPTLEAHIKELDLSNAVRLLGNRSDVAQLLQAADVFLFPSSWEGLGIVAIEAQAAGLPCLCSDHVPALAKVTDQCVFLPLQENIWVQQIAALEYDRHDTYDRIAEAGFDVIALAPRLQKFYLDIWNS